MKLSELPVHHALLVTGPDREAYTHSLWADLSAQSPAHRYFNQTVLDMETARNIIAWAQSPYHGERVALVSFHTAGLPAQNAMLKVLEEPKDGTRFILVTTHKKNLIDTVLSRVRHIFHEVKDMEKRGYADEFIATSSSSRMKLPFVVRLLAQVDEEGRKDRESVKRFIFEIVEALHQRRAGHQFVMEAMGCASYASDPSASGKALLEYLALMLPQMKE